MTTKSVSKIRLKKGDMVMVRTGSQKGKTGSVLSVHPLLNAVTVEGINVVKKHQKPSKKYPQGGIIELTKPISVAKVGIVDPTTKKASKIGYKVNKDGSKVRYYKKSGKEIK